MKRSLLLISAFLCYTLTFAQSSHIQGFVSDSTTGNALVGATVKLTKDAVLINGAVANVKGEFRFTGLADGTYMLEVKLLGYNTKARVIKIPEQGGQIQIALSSSSTDLDQVNVRAKAAIGQVKGDTSEFDARAFKTGQNASAGDLVEKIPGVQNQDGTVKAEGEEVQQVLVDGKPFFGQDVKTALGVLPAEAVEKIQVFDDQSEQSKASGVDDGTRVKTINIVTKINMRKGEFGKIYGGYGTNDRYSVGGNVNIFRGERRFTVLAQTNNINIQNFSTSDLLGVVADNTGRGHHRGPAFMRGFSVGSDASDFMVNSQDGIVSTIAAGINYQDRWTSKTEVSSSYFFNRADRESWKKSYQLYFLEQQAGQEYNELDSSNSMNSNHRFNAKITYELNDNVSFYMLPQFNLQLNEGRQDINGMTSLEGSVQTALNNMFSSDLGAYNWSNDLMFRARGKKAGRSFFFRGKVGNSFSNGERSLRSDDLGFVNPVNILDQRSKLDNSALDLVGSLMYSEPIGDKGMNVFFTYDISNTQDKSDLETYELGIAEDAFDSLLSNRNNNDWLSQMVATGVRKFNRNFGFVVRMKYERNTLFNEQLIPDAVNVEKTFNNFLPFALIRMQIKEEGNIFAMYRTYTQAPGAGQLQENINNSNPLLVTQGNRALTQQYMHYFRLRYRFSDKSKSTMFYAGIRASYSNSYIGTETFTAFQDEFVNGYLLPQGSQISMPVNLKGYSSLNSMVNYALPINVLSSNFNVSLSNTVRTIPMIVNNTLASSQNALSELGLILTSNISEKVDFTISSTSGYTSVSNSLSDALNNQYYIQRSKIKYNWVMPYGITFRTVFEHQQFFGLSDDLDNQVLLWTAGIGKQIFRNKRGEIQLSVFDILGQNNQISQQFQANYYQEQTSQVLTRYFMLNFSYNLRKFRQGGEIKEEPEPQRFRH